MKVHRILAAAGLTLVTACGSTSAIQANTAPRAHGQTPVARTATTSAAAALPAAGSLVHGPKGFPPAVSGGQLARPVANFHGTGLRMDPPPAGQVPSVAAAAAYAVCATERSNPCDRPAGPTMIAALATGIEGGTVRADGSVKPAFDLRLIWTLSWPKEMCILQLEPSPFQSYNSVSEVPCIRTMLVDATTGKYLGTYAAG
jgi:hypothetical protein